MLKLKMFIEALGLKVKDEFDYNGQTLKDVIINGDKPLLFNIGDNVKLPVVMPTPYNSARLDIVENGESKRNLILFDPLRENVLNGSGNTWFINRFLQLISIVLSASLNTVVQLLLSGRINNITNGEVSKLNLIIGKHYKKINITKTHLNKWIQINNGNDLVLKLSLKKNVKLDGETYEKGLIITSPLLELLEKGEEFNVKLDNKQLDILTITLRHVFSGLSNKVVTATDDKVTPAFINMVAGYSTLGKKLNRMLESLRSVDNTLVDEFKLNVDYDLEEIIDDIPNMLDHLAMVHRNPPTKSDVVKSIETSKKIRKPKTKIIKKVNKVIKDDREPILHGDENPDNLEASYIVINGKKIYSDNTTYRGTTKPEKSVDEMIAERVAQELEKYKHMNMSSTSNNNCNPYQQNDYQNFDLNTKMKNLMTQKLTLNSQIEEKKRLIQMYKSSGNIQVAMQINEETMGMLNQMQRLDVELNQLNTILQSQQNQSYPQNNYGTQQYNTSNAQYNPYQQNGYQNQSNPYNQNIYSSQNNTPMSPEDEMDLLIRNR